MPDLSDFLPEQSKTVEAIYAHYKSIGDAEPSRGYLGASIIGHPCERYLWFAFRHCCKSDFSGRMYRLFETGDLAEPRFTDNLRAIGCTVHTHDASGSQFSISALGGHFAGHMDGCLLGLPEAPKTWHVGEFKTHSDKNFKILKRKGVKEGFPKHYAQMQIPMHLTGMKRALYLAVNKDTDELYSERIHYNEGEAEALMNRAELIIKSQSPLAGISDRPDWWQCKFCDARHLCFGSMPPDPVLNVPSLSCRQCCHATPSMDGIDGRWVCEKRRKALSATDQAAPCDSHLVLPGLLPQFPYVECGKDHDDDFLIFGDDGGGKFKHGKGTGCFSSEELAILPAPVLLSPMVACAKDVFQATAVACCEDILDRYPEGDCETLWKGSINGLVDAWSNLFNGEAIQALTPIAVTNLPTHCVAEYAGGLIAIAYVQEGKAEIRKGKE